MQQRWQGIEYSQLKDLLNDFHQLTQIRISFWNSEGVKCIMAPDSGNSDFCKELRKVACIDEQCHICDAQALQSAPKEESGLYRFNCLAGLREYVYPVFYNKSLLGYFMYGQVRNAYSDLAGRQQREELYRNNGLNAEYLGNLYERLPIIDDEAMHSAGRMLAALASYAYLNGLMWNYNLPLRDKIERYLSNHFMDDININTACYSLCVSRSTLTHTIQREMGSTFVMLLNQRRVKNVKRCLENNQSILDACFNSGFHSINYMTRMFKRLAGCTPAQYKRAHPRED